MDQIVLVDDEPEILNLQKDALREMGFSIQAFSGARAAWEFLKSNSDVALVVTDWNMPEMSGMDLLFNIRGLSRPPYVILLTAFGTIDRAVKAMNLGAFDFLEKPLDIERYRADIKAALQLYRNQPATLGASPTRKSTKSKVRTAVGPVVASSTMKAVYETARSAAATESSILLLGESGTGKEVLADFIHQNSVRAAAQIIKVNCAALPEHLMESELFGHEKGSFTGADRRNIGRFEQASGGTLFLDEIGDLPLPVQVKLLRALQDRVIERVGTSTPVQVDFRLICATHQNLKAAVAKGTFREDLYYRINVVPIRLPALRERLEEVGPLAEHFLMTMSGLVHTGRKTFDQGALTCLSGFSWPGNVRQLRNAVEYALVLSKGDVINANDLPEEVRRVSGLMPAVMVNAGGSAIASNATAKVAPVFSTIPPSPPSASPTALRDSVMETEAELIRSTLKKNRWRVSKSAKDLQISRSTLYQRIKTYGIERE